jgi:hypothetical protein
MIPNELTSNEAVEQAVAWALANSWIVEPHVYGRNTAVTQWDPLVREPCSASEANCVVFRKAGNSDQWYRLAWWVRARFVEVAG